jgi:hypothetical protein
MVCQSSADFFFFVKLFLPECTLLYQPVHNHFTTATLLSSHAALLEKTALDKLISYGMETFKKISVIASVNVVMRMRSRD